MKNEKLRVNFMKHYLSSKIVDAMCLHSSRPNSVFLYMLRVTLLGCIILTSPLASAANHKAFQDVAPLEKALTLAQIQTARGPATLLVIKQQGMQISAVNLSQILNMHVVDPLTLVANVGADRVRALAEEPLGLFDLSELIVPQGLSSEQLAAGANYAAHGREGGLDRVFLFPKYSSPTPGNAPMAVDPHELLDYEVEICARFDRNIQSAEEISDAIIGIFLCGDFTDRAALMRNIDVDNWESGAGYTDGKSGPGRFPVGFYTVVPNDWPSFVNEIELQLSVNNRIRQIDRADKMILKFDEILELAFKESVSTRWIYKDQNISLLKDGILYRGQSIVSGTPEGVVFRPPEKTFIIIQVVNWLATGSFLTESAADYVIENYIEASLASRTYLQPGDRISMMATYLGTAEFSVTASTPDKQ